MSTKVDQDDFIIVRNNTHGEVLTSREAVRYWDCRKISDFEYQVTNNSGAPNITITTFSASPAFAKLNPSLFSAQVTDSGWMHAVFLMPDQGSHYCQRESRGTRSSRSSSQTRGSNRARRNQRDSSRSRSRARN